MTNLLDTLLLPLASAGPVLLVYGLGIILFFSRREERPRAALLVLISILLSGATTILQPFTFGIAAQWIQNSNGNQMLQYAMLSFLFTLPHAVATGMLIWAAYMPDNSTGSNSRRYDEDR